MIDDEVSVFTMVCRVLTLGVVTFLLRLIAIVEDGRVEGREVDTGDFTVFIGSWRVLPLGSYLVYLLLLGDFYSFVLGCAFLFYCIFMSFTPALADPFICLLLVNEWRVHLYPTVQYGLDVD